MTLSLPCVVCVAPSLYFECGGEFVLPRRIGCFDISVAGRYVHLDDFYHAAGFARGSLYQRLLLNARNDVQRARVVIVTEYPSHQIVVVGDRVVGLEG